MIFENDNIILSSKELSIGYKNNILLENLNLSLFAGELVCLIGPNGCGKSTLIRTLSGLQEGCSGSIFIKDENIKSLNYHKRAKLISIVLTERMNANSLSVQQIVSLGRYPYTNWLGKLSSSDEEIIANSIGLVHLTEKKDNIYMELSDGEKQRAMIAKALAQDTSIVFLDEPTAHLDLPNKIDIMLLLRKLARETKKSIFLSTHELDLALQTTDKIWLLNDKKIEKGVPEDLVLTKKIETTFGTDRFQFDENTGNFCMNYETTKSVQLIGNGHYKYWTKRAVNREGYGISENASIKITTTERNTWIIQYNGFKREEPKIENLLSTIAQLEK